MGSKKSIRPPPQSFNCLHIFKKEMHHSMAAPQWELPCARRGISFPLSFHAPVAHSLASLPAWRAAASRRGEEGGGRATGACPPPSFPPCPHMKPDLMQTGWPSAELARKAAEQRGRECKEGAALPARRPAPNQDP